MGHRTASRHGCQAFTLRFDGSRWESLALSATDESGRIVVRDIVGHSDIEVTMTIYAHAALDEKRKELRS